MGVTSSASPATDRGVMTSARNFLVRGLLVGLFAGILAFGVAYAIGEPSVNASIAIEEAGSAEHAHPGEVAEPQDSHETEVPRSLQSTLGLLTGTVVAGVTLGGLVAVLSALALGRFGGLGVRSTTLLISGIGFVTCYLLPFVAYPPNPPAVGHADTIGLRTGLYFTMLAISLVAGVTAVIVGRILARGWGAWYASLVAVAGYLLVTLVSITLLPTYNEVPASFPATVLYEFRAASVVIQLTLWTVLGVGLAEALHRLTIRSAGLAQAKTAYADAAG
jgi:predicted cobalt transporter CbtA